jgi:hypothetical protein
VGRWEQILSASSANSDDPAASWSWHSGMWLAELLQPHRLLGLCRALSNVTESDARYSFELIPGEWIPSPYDGCLEGTPDDLVITVTAGSGYILSAEGHHQDGRTNRFDVVEAAFGDRVARERLRQITDEWR